MPRDSIVEARRGRHVDHLLAQRPRPDGHVVQGAGHAIDDGGVRAGDVDHDRRRDFRTVVESHAEDTSGVFRDLDDLAPEPELRSLRLRRALQVVGRELRVGDVPGGRPEHASCELAAARLSEPLVGHQPGRAVPARVVDREPLPNLVGIPLLERDAELPGQADMFLQVVVELGLHHEAAALDELCETTFVVRFEVLRPLVPVVIALPRERGAVVRGVVHPDDGARARGRPVAGGRQPVNVQRPVARAWRARRAVAAPMMPAPMMMASYLSRMVCHRRECAERVDGRKVVVITHCPYRHGPGQST